MTEEIDTAETKVVTSPQPKAETLATATPIAMRFLSDARADCLEMIGLEYARMSQLRLSPIGAADETLLAGMCAIMRKFGMLDRFGVKLLNSEQMASDERVLLEFTDKINRTLTCLPSLRGTVKANNATETIWTFVKEAAAPIGDPMLARVTPLRACTRRCERTCTKYSSGVHEGGVHVGGPHY